MSQSVAGRVRLDCEPRHRGGQRKVRSPRRQLDLALAKVPRRRIPAERTKPPASRARSQSPVQPLPPDRACWGLRHGSRRRRVRLGRDPSRRETLMTPRSDKLSTEAGTGLGAAVLVIVMVTVAEFVGGLDPAGTGWLAIAPFLAAAFTPWWYVVGVGALATVITGVTEVLYPGGFGE